MDTDSLRSVIAYELLQRSLGKLASQVPRSLGKLSASTESA